MILPATINGATTLKQLLENLHLYDALIKVCDTEVQLARAVEILTDPSGVLGGLLKALGSEEQGRTDAEHS